MADTEDIFKTGNVDFFEDLLKQAFTHAFSSVAKKFNSEEFKNLFDKYKENSLAFFLRKYDEGILLIQVGETHDSAKKHALVKNSLLSLKEKGFLHLCLEFEHTFQKTYDAYVSTGEEKYLEKIIDRERVLAKRGYPSDKRIDSGYFDILRVAKKIGLQVHFVDSDFDTLDDKAEKRDPEMAVRIPKGEKTLFYCGEGHLPTVNHHIQKIIPTYPVFTVGQVEKGDKLQRILSDALGDKKYTEPYACDLTLHKEMREIFQKCFLNSYKYFDAIVCHTSL